MAITQVDLKFQGQNADSSVDSSGKRTRTFFDACQVISDDPNESPDDVGDASLIPDIFQQHPTFLTARVQSISVKRRSGTRLVRDVEVKYATGIIDKDIDPLARDPKISWGSSQWQKVFTQDRNGNPFVNSAGTPFSAEKTQGDDARWVINVSANVESVPAWVLLSNNHVNDASVTIGGITFTDELLKLQNLQISDLQTENDIEFYQLSFQLHFRREGWQLKLLNEGFAVWDDTHSKQIVATLDEERPTEPVLLDSNGAILLNPKDPAQATFQAFDLYFTMDMAAMPGVDAA